MTRATGDETSSAVTELMVRARKSVLYLPRGPMGLQQPAQLE
jgi:hypothetical protein